MAAQTLSQRWQRWQRWRRMAVAGAIVVGPTLLLWGGCLRTRERDRIDHALPGPQSVYAAELKEREAFAKKTLEDVDAGRAWGVSSTAEITFEEGFGIIMYDPPDQTKAPSFYNHAFRWMGQRAHVRLKTHGDHEMKLHMEGWIHENVIRTNPVITLYVDGFYLPRRDPKDEKPIEDGHYWIDEVIPAWMLKREWVDLSVRINSVGFHWGDPPELNIALVYRFAWTEAN